jgi:hypothetical protein
MAMAQKIAEYGDGWHISEPGNGDPGDPDAKG